MTPFELVEPASLDEAIALLDPDDSTVRPIAGGTALMLMMKAGVFRPTRLVSLRKLGARYSSVAAGTDGAARHDEERRGCGLRDRVVAEHLGEAEQECAGPQRDDCHEDDCGEHPARDDRQ